MQSTVLRRVVVHDRYQLEFKLGYPLQKGKETRYRIDTYIFTPHSLGINAISYPQAEFYRNMQHYVRMKTPSFQLHEVLESSNSPLVRSETLLNGRILGLSPADEEALRDSLRILRAVLKSATQNHLAPLSVAPLQVTEETEAQFADLIGRAVDAIAEIERRYRALSAPLDEARATPELLRAFHLTDESISVLIEDTLLRVHQAAGAWVAPPCLDAWRARLAACVQAEIDYRRDQGYPSVLHKGTRESYLRRVSALKKFTSSVLWLSTNTQREGATLEQLLYAIAAGVSMVFATMVAFYMQSVYGQFTMPVFVALVVAYMFKDRIKDLGRAFSSRMLNRRLYDYRTVIETQDGRRKLGYVREKAFYLSPKEAPADVLAARGAGALDDPAFAGNYETVLLYGKQVTLRKNAFAYLSKDGIEISAINDIMRFDVRPFLRKMDDPYEERLMLKGSSVRTVRCHRTYHLNMVSVFSGEDGATTCERTLVIMDRKGIQRIEQYDAAGRVVPGDGRHLAVADMAESD